MLARENGATIEFGRAIRARSGAMARKEKETQLPLAQLLIVSHQLRHSFGPFKLVANLSN